MNQNLLELEYGQKNEVLAREDFKLFTKEP